MENATSAEVVLNNPADIVVIVGYFLAVIGVGVWVRRRSSRLDAGAGEANLLLCFSPCLGATGGRSEGISWRGEP